MDLQADEEITEDEDYEPQVTSKNPTERIMARRLRIQRRSEALRKQKEVQKAEGEDIQLEPDVLKTPIEVQVERSMDLLEKLMEEGDVYVTNVRVATEAREADRRERDGIDREKLLQQLEEEAASASSMFNEIADKWSGILKYNDPLHINEDIACQKERCDELIRQKDGIIAELRDKLKKAEIDFAIDQRKQMEDVNAISRRIENQIIVMRKAYKTELQMVEEVILAERHLQIEAGNKKWEDLYKKRDQEETSNAELRSEDFWRFVQDMDDLSRDFRELYRDTTIKLEKDCDDLQKEFERIKTEAVMNSEKLDYNYQILKKRADENLIIRSQQKRRINKLQDVVNSKRKRNCDYHTHTVQQIDKLTEEIRRLTQNILDVEEKADHLASVNHLKFSQIWKMNKAKANKLVRRILDIDKILYEQQLGLNWKSPDLKLPSKGDMGSYKSAMTTTLEMKQKERPDSSLSLHNFDAETEKNAFYKRALNHILELVADKGGFLIEEQLNAILEPYLEHEKTLVKVDNVFEALNVRDRHDIDLLLEHFIPFMFCPICNVAPEKVTADDESVMKVTEMDPLTIADLEPSDFKPDSDVTIEELLHESSQEQEQDHGSTLVEFGPLSVILFDENLKGECRGPEKVEEVSKEKELDSVRSSTDIHQRVRLPCQYQHPLMISSVFVLKALKEFLSKYHIPKPSMPPMSVRLAHKRSTVSRLLALDDIDLYWSKYTEIFPQERKQLWDALLEALKKYNELLKARKVTSEEVMCLRQQNKDLRRVFANYVDKADIPY